MPSARCRCIKCSHFLKQSCQKNYPLRKSHKFPPCRCCCD